MNEKYEYWLKNIDDKEIVKKLTALNKDKIEQNFSSSLSFGTAGIRGVMELGTNTINLLTVGKLAYALGQYARNKRIVICFDTRNNSKNFSRLFAKILSDFQIEVLLFKNYAPTPTLVFASTYLKCDYAVNITASHNRKEYNGIKIYGNDGIQIDEEEQKKITSLFDATNEVEVFNKYQKMRLKKVKFVGKKILDAYINGTYEKQKRSIKITYTALNGTGFKPLKKLFAYNGFKVSAVQTKKDPNFTTCPYPNPEFEEAFAVAKKKALKNGSDIIIATDPDADRLGVMVKSGNTFKKLSGNEVGYIFADALLSEKQGNIVVTSVVTSPLIDKICKKYNAKLYKTLTGFLSMGKKAKELAKTYGRESIALIYEESCGYVVNNAYDKDGIFAGLKMAQIAEKLKKNGKTLLEYLAQIYEKYGNLTALEDSLPTKNSQMFIEKIRKNHLKTLKIDIKEIIDYQNDNTGLPKQNFLEFKLEDGSFILRPSGTEPKLKIYLFHQDPDFAHALLKNLKDYIIKLEKL